MRARTDNRVALVTGSSRGIGKGIALRLAADGYNVGLTAVEALDDTVAEIEKLGRRAIASVDDFRHPSVAAEVIENVAAEFGRLDVLVNNAGVVLTRPFEQMTEKELVEIFSVNFFSGYLAARAAVPHMERAGGGAIVNISSIHSLRGMVDHSAYAATKGAINASTRELGIELAPKRIRVNAILPGIIEVEATRENPLYSSERAGRVVPWGRPGFPTDVAGAVAFLVGSDADFITGQCLGVDGGSGALMPIRLSDVLDE